jgi:hypothetical protein
LKVLPMGEPLGNTGAQSVTIANRAEILPRKQPVPGVLDMEHFDAIFERVDEAEIIPPCST